MKQQEIRFIFILSMFLVSCTGNDGLTQQDKETVFYQRQIDTTTSYFPEKYKEEIIDSLIDSIVDLRVRILKKTLMDKSVVKLYESDSNHVQKDVYRDNAISFKVTKGKIILLDTTLTKERFPQIGDKDFLNQAIMWNGSIQTYNKAEGAIVMTCNVTVPETDWTYHFSINVDDKGKKEILLENIE